MINVQKTIKRCDGLIEANANWRSYFEDLSSFCLPRKAWINSIRMRGERLKFNFLYDSTAIRSLKIMAAGFHSNLTNPSSKWFTLRTRDLEYMKERGVQLWFKEVEEIIFSTLSDSNFDTTMQEFYLNAGCFGTGAILTLEDALEKVRFTEIPIEQIGLEEDSYGRVNRVYRTFHMTVQQAFDLWGAKSGEAVTEKLENKPNDSLKFLHYIGPRDVRDATKEDSINMPFVSAWIEKSKKHLIGEGGFLDNPYAVGRFYKDTNDVFGFSPAMDVLADTKLVNAQTKTMLRAAMKQSDPALVVPRRGYILPLNANPGALNYRDVKTPTDALTQLPSGGNLPITIEVIQMVQMNIEKAFFVPLFQAISNITKQMTVPEVQRRIAENMVLLGPVVGRFTQEVMDPIIMRVFDILYRSGELPEPPDSIRGQALRAVYISPLARAQRESEIYSIENFLQDVALIGQVKPEVRDKIDGDQTVDIMAQVRGVSPEIIVSDEKVAEIRKARAEQQAQVQKMAEAEQLAGVLQKGGAGVASLGKGKGGTA